jgi:RNA polymerase sigma-70 factor (ECF subfamily)
MFAQSDLINETVKLQKFALRLTKNKDDADDLLQSTCLRALEKADQFEGGTNLFSWTSKIMFNLFISDYRRRTKFESKYDPEPTLEKQTVEPMQHIKMELADLAMAMQKLSAEHREVLVMICAKGMCYKEAAKLLHIPIGTVRSRLFRAREQLQTIMDTPAPQATMRIMAPERPANENIPVIPAYIASHAMQRKTA